MTDTFQPDVTQELAGLWREMRGLKDMLETVLLRDQKAAAKDDEDQPDEEQPKKGGRRVAVYFDYDQDMNKIPSDDGEYGIVLTFDAEGRLEKSEHVRRVDRATATKSDDDGWQEPEDVVEDFKDGDGGWDEATEDGDLIVEDADEDDDPDDEDAFDELDAAV